MAQELNTQPTRKKSLLPSLDLSPLTLWSQVDAEQLLVLFKAYYTRGLRKSDQALPVRDAKAVPMPHVEPTGPSLMSKVSWDQFDGVIRHLRRIRVDVGNRRVTGWYIYVLKIHLGLEQAHWQKNEDFPKVTVAHKKEARDVLARAFQRLVLNGEPLDSPEQTGKTG